MPDPLEQLATALIADGRRDREVLRRRWNAPSWRIEIERIADALERYPLLIPTIEQTIDDELHRLGEAIETSQTDDTSPSEATADAD